MKLGASSSSVIIIVIIIIVITHQSSLILTPMSGNSVDIVTIVTVGA
jgi:uncharacterized membrane protein (DUF485 family)